MESLPARLADWLSWPVRQTLLSQMIKATTAALGTVLPRLRSPSLGRLAEQLSPVAPSCLAAWEASTLFSCRAEETEGGTHSCHTERSATHRLSTGKERGCDCPAQREKGKRHRYSAASFLENREL